MVVRNLRWQWYSVMRMLISLTRWDFLIQMEVKGRCDSEGCDNRATRSFTSDEGEEAVTVRTRLGVMKYTHLINQRHFVLCNRHAEGIGWK